MSSMTTIYCQLTDHADCPAPYTCDCGCHELQAERLENLRNAIAAAEAEAERLERLGGPRRTERAAREREHARLWKLELEGIAR